jgi:hypothetical protein
MKLKGDCIEKNTEHDDFYLLSLVYYRLWWENRELQVSSFKCWKLVVI